MRFKRKSLNKIHISMPEIKHTNSKLIITTYVYNKEKISLLKRIQDIRVKWRLFINKFYLNIVNLNNKKELFFNNSFDYKLNNISKGSRNVNI